MNKARAKAYFSRQEWKPLATDWRLEGESERSRAERIAHVVWTVVVPTAFPSLENSKKKKTTAKDFAEDTWPYGSAVVADYVRLGEAFRLLPKLVAKRLDPLFAGDSGVCHALDLGCPHVAFAFLEVKQESGSRVDVIQKCQNLSVLMRFAQTGSWDFLWRVSRRFAVPIAECCMQTVLAGRLDVLAKMIACMWTKDQFVRLEHHERVETARAIFCCPTRQRPFVVRLCHAIGITKIEMLYSMPFQLGYTGLMKNLFRSYGVVVTDTLDHPIAEAFWARIAMSSPRVCNCVCALLKPDQLALDTLDPHVRLAVSAVLAGNALFFLNAADKKRKAGKEIAAVVADDEEPTRSSAKRKPGEAAVAVAAKTEGIPSEWNVTVLPPPKRKKQQARRPPSDEDDDKEEQEATATRITTDTEDDDELRDSDVDDA